MFSRSFLAQGSLRAVRIHLIAAAVASIGLSACGDSKKATTTTTGTTVTTPAGNGNSTTTVTTGGTTTTSTSTVNSDKNGTEPTDPSTSSVVVTPASGSTVNLSYALLTNNPNATDANKRYGVTFYDYDPCIFTWNHGYSAFPSATFNFAAFFLENGTAGTVPAAGDYTASATATSGMYIAAATTGQSGSGYGITSCKAASYAGVQSGKVSLTSSWAASGGTVGSINVTMTDGSTIAGSFTILSCKAGSATSQPTPPSPDSAACTSIK